MPRITVRPAPLIAACVAGAAAYLAIPAGSATPVAPRPSVVAAATPTATPLDLWHRVPKGKRALAVRTDEVAGVAGFVRPGQHVDVIGVARDGERWLATTVAQDLQVLAVAQDDQDRGGSTPTPGPLGGGQPRIATSTTLLASPVQAEAISLAAERGALRLALRGPQDHAIRKVAPPPAAPPPPPRPKAQIFPPMRLQPTAKPARPAPPPPKPAVEIIRGMPIPEGI